MKEKDKIVEIMSVIEKYGDVIKNLTDLVEKNASLHGEAVDEIIMLGAGIKKIQKVLSWIIFSIFILAFRVFFWDGINQILGILIKSYGALSENYKILILGFPAALIIATASNLISAFIIKRIRNKTE